MQESLGGFSSNDAYGLLLNAVTLRLKEESNREYAYPYIADIFEDSLVYSNGYSNGGMLYRCSYDLDENGAVALGEATPVVRKTQYIDQTVSESDIDIETDAIPLLESTTALSEATRMLKLIAPGWGSSGYYSADVLKRDGPLVFKAGMHNYIDHPTVQEQKERPEGTITKLGSVLQEDAKWFDDYNGAGPGLYAPAKTNDGFGSFLETFAKDIGVSIRGKGKDREGEAEGKKGRIIEAITSAASVDYVTRAGAGGKVLDLLESYRSDTKLQESTIMSDTQAVNLEETIKRFNLRLARNDAERIVSKVLGSQRLKEAIKSRIAERVLSDIPLNEANDVDTEKLNQRIATITEAELSYLTSAGIGKIAGVGPSEPTNETSLETAQKEFEEALKALD